MGISTTNSAETVTINEQKFITGVLPFKVLTVNPSLAELHNLGMDYLKQEPSYIGQSFDGEKKQVNVRVWLRNEECKGVNSSGEEVIVKGGDVIIPVEFKIDEGVHLSSSGNTMFINGYGMTAYAGDLEGVKSYDWLPQEGLREGYRGEENLAAFFFAWANMTKTEGNQCILDDPEKLFKGDYSEIKTVLEALKDYTIKCLVGLQVSEKETEKGVFTNIYSRVYNKYFLKSFVNTTAYLKGFIEKEAKDGKCYNEFKGVDIFKYDVTVLTRSDIETLTPKADAETPDPAAEFGAPSGGNDINQLPF